MREVSFGMAHAMAIVGCQLDRIWNKLRSRNEGYTCDLDLEAGKQHTSDLNLEAGRQRLLI